MVKSTEEQQEKQEQRKRKGEKTTLPWVVGSEQNDIPVV